MIGVAMVSIFFFAISGAWLLLVGVSEDEATFHRVQHDPQET
jgi:hypothetical protein